MMTVIAIAVFLGAFAASVAVIAASIAPQWRRIARLAAGHVEQPFAPLTHLASAERRIAVRRWASAPVATSVTGLLPVPVSRMRAAA